MIATGVSNSIESSIADWADIIGPELATLDRIQELKEEDLSVTVVDHLLPASQIDARIEKLDSLIKSLPLQLQVVARAERKQEVMTDARQLDRERARKGIVQLPGFWDDTFTRDVWDLAVGDRLTVRTGDVESRTGCLVAYDDQDHPVGVMTNRLASAAYSYFAASVIKHVGKSQFAVELTEIDRTASAEGRHYFKVKLIDYSPLFASAVLSASHSAKEDEPAEAGKHTKQ